MKQSLKDLRDRAVGGIGRATWRFRRGLLVLTYHRVLPRDHEDIPIVEPGMRVFVDTFDRQLAFLSRHFEFVDLAHWLDGTASQLTKGKPACAITFDDGWRDNYQFAFPVLKEYRAPATIFVVSSMIGTYREFWPERMARLLRNREKLVSSRYGTDWLSELVVPLMGQDGRLTNDLISAVITRAKSMPDEVIRQKLTEIEVEEGVPTNTKPALFNWDEAAEMLETGLISLGSHTKNHVRLGDDLPGIVLESEIVGSREEILTRTGVEPTLFCYPNGTICEEGDKLVRDLYRGACTTSYGWHLSGGDPFAVPRVHIHEDRTCTDDAFSSRITTSSV